MIPSPRPLRERCSGCRSWRDPRLFHRSPSNPTGPGPKLKTCVQCRIRHANRVPRKPKKSALQSPAPADSLPAFPQEQPAPPPSQSLPRFPPSFFPSDHALEPGYLLPIAPAPTPHYTPVFAQPLKSFDLMIAPMFSEMWREWEGGSSSQGGEGGEQSRSSKPDMGQHGMAQAVSNPNSNLSPVNNSNAPTSSASVINDHGVAFQRPRHPPIATFKSYQYPIPGMRHTYLPHPSQNPNQNFQPGASTSPIASSAPGASLKVKLYKPKPPRPAAPSMEQYPKSRYGVPNNVAHLPGINTDPTLGASTNAQVFSSLGQSTLPPLGTALLSSSSANANASTFSSSSSFRQNTINPTSGMNLNSVAPLTPPTPCPAPKPSAKEHLPPSPYSLTSV